MNSHKDYVWEITYTTDKGRTKKVKIEMGECIHPSSVKTIQLYNKYVNVEYNPISYLDIKEDQN